MGKVEKIATVMTVLGYIFYIVLHIYASYMAYLYSNFFGVLLTFFFPVGGPFYWLFYSIGRFGLINSYSILSLLTLVMWIPIFIISALGER